MNRRFQFAVVASSAGVAGLLLFGAVRGRGAAADNTPYNQIQVYSEVLSRMLKRKGIVHNVLNAKFHQSEAEIVARAGQRGAITIATNMAGRGTDIKLGDGVAALGGLHVIATERHESGRGDRQLIGRSARQGDPGTAQQYASAEDELIRRFLPRPLAVSLKGATAALGPALFARAQSRAQKIAFRQRQSVLRSDTWLDESLAFTTNL